MTDSLDRLQGALSTLGAKAPVLVATTGNITLSGLQAVDGVTVAEGDRVLVKNQTAGAENGIWAASTGAWTRTKDFDGNTDFVQGTLISVARGSANAGILYRLSNVGPQVVGTTELTFAQIQSTPTESTFYDVRDYGAVGDGTTDDSGAFQDAVDAASLAGGQRRVYAPDTANGYAFGATVTVPDNILIFGDNKKGLQLSRIKPTSGFTAPLFKTDDYGVTRKLRVGLEGLYLDGSSTTLTAIAMNCQESHFRDLTIKNCFTYGIHLGGVGSGATQQALNNHIEDCYLSGLTGSVEFFDGIFIDYNSADNTIRDSYVEACKDAGIRSRGYNNKFINNHIYNVSGTGGGAGHGFYVETAADHDISHNYIELIVKSAVFIDGGAADFATLAGTVVGNICRNINTGAGVSGVITVQGSNVSALTITGNVVRRDNATSYTTLYFAHFSSITPARARVALNEWQDGLVTIAETNITLDSHVNTLAVSNSAVTEVDLMTTTLPAGLLNPGGVGLRVRAFGSGTTVSTAATRRLRMYFGASVIADTSAATVPTLWQLDATILRTSVAGAQEAFGTHTWSSGASSGGVTGCLRSSPAEGLSSAIIVRVTGLCTASTGVLTQTAFTLTRVSI
jgi:hypothetical protein